MFTRFMKAGSWVNAGLSNFYIDITFPANCRVIVLKFYDAVDKTRKVAGIQVQHDPPDGTYYRRLDVYGYKEVSGVGGTYLAFLIGEPGEVYRLSWASTYNNLFQFYYMAQNTAAVLINGSSIGPVSISTKCYAAEDDFTVVFLARPLFVNRFPLLTYYQASTELVTLPDVDSLGFSVGDPIYKVIEDALSRHLQYNLVFEKDDDNIGLVTDISFSGSMFTAGAQVPRYSTPYTITIGMITYGVQDLPDPIIIGRDNPSKYLKRCYVPSYADTNSMEYETIKATILSAGKDEIQSSGAIMFEHNNLYMGEDSPMRYVLLCFAIEGAGQVMVSPDYAPKFMELSEYEF